MSQAIRGTSAQLAGRLVLNGQRLDQPSISFLTRLFDGNGVKRIDTVRTTTGRGGKPAIVWEFDPSQFKLDMKMGRKPRSANDEGETNGNGGSTNTGTEGKRRPGRPTNAEREQRAQQAQSNQPQGDLASAIGAAIAQQMAPVVERLDKLADTMAQPQASTTGEPDAGSEAGKGDEGAQANGGENGNGSNGSETDNGNETDKQASASKATASKPAASKSASVSNKGKGKK